MIVWKDRFMLSPPKPPQSNCHCLTRKPFCMSWFSTAYRLNLGFHIRWDCVSYSYHKTYYGTAALFYVDFSTMLLKTHTFRSESGAFVWSKLINKATQTKKAENTKTDLLNYERHSVIFFLKEVNVCGFCAKVSSNFPITVQPRSWMN